MTSTETLKKKARKKAAGLMDNAPVTTDKLVDEEQVLEGFSSVQRVSGSQTNLFPDTA